MPVLGWAKLRLGRRLDSGAISGEGTENLLVRRSGTGRADRRPRCRLGPRVLDPIAALLIGGVAAREGAELSRFP
jgi:hypothetical protein